MMLSILIAFAVAAVAGVLGLALSPVARAIVRETILAPTQDSVIVVDDDTGQVVEIRRSKGSAHQPAHAA